MRLPLSFGSARGPVPTLPLFVTLCSLLALMASRAQAQEQAHEEAPPAADRLAHEAFQIDDADPESSVPTQEQAIKSPLKMGYYIMLLIERGQQAEQSGDSEAAVRFFRALAKATPDRSTGLSELCRVYQKRGDIDAAIEACRSALGKGGVRVQDNVRYVSLLVRKPTDLSPRDVDDAEAVLEHLDKELKDDAQVAEVVLGLRCELATRLSDVVRAERCVRELKRKAPDDPKTLAYTFALLLQKDDFDGARNVLAHAHQIALPRDAIQKMERTLTYRIEANAEAGARFWDVRFLAGVLALLVGVGFVFNALRKRRQVAASHAG